MSTSAGPGIDADEHGECRTASPFMVGAGSHGNGVATFAFPTRVTTLLVSAAP